MQNKQVSKTFLYYNITKLKEKFIIAYNITPDSSNFFLNH